MLALLGCYVIIAFGTLGALSSLVDRKLDCDACGHETHAARATKWLAIAMIALTWPLLVAIVLVEILEHRKR